LFFIFTHLRTCVVNYGGCGWNLSVVLEIKRSCLLNFCHLEWDFADWYEKGLFNGFLRFDFFLRLFFKFLNFLFNGFLRFESCFLIFECSL
jgi:hypothetical protein